MTSAVSRGVNRAKRQVIARVAPVNRLVQRTYESRLREHRPFLPPVSDADARLIERVERTGVAITSLSELALPGTGELMGILDGLRQTLSARDPKGESAIKPHREELIADTRLWQWGLGSRMLDIVENYIGLPVRYHGPAIYREVADGRVEGTRQWHRDIEDHKVFKILVWLNDVGLRGGAFQYIPKELSDPAVGNLRYVAGFVSDDSVRAQVSDAEWVKATGPRWTAVMADPARILHRASAAEDRDRYSVTFTWTSRHPIKTKPPAEDFTAAELERLRQGLDARQLACLSW